MVEKLVKWEPIVNLANKYSIEYVSDDFDEFKVLLCEVSSNKKMWMRFESAIGSYRRINKCFQESNSYKLYEKYEAASGAEWTFFTVDNSSYIQWLSEESYAWSDYRSFIHFSIVASDSILDIAVGLNPTFELI